MKSNTRNAAAVSLLALFLMPGLCKAQKQKTLTLPDSSVYIGQARGGKPHGEGSQEFKTGDKYQGQWVEGLRQGQGTRTYADGRVYVGEWMAGRMHGQGSMTWANGDSSVYVGAWANDLRAGQGTCTYADGRVYVGEWAADKRQGQGTETMPSGEKYVGTWANDLRAGQGTCTYAQGAVYVGSWANGSREGQGTYTFADGRVYVGEWAADKRQGQGSMTWANGEKYVGSWANGLREGQGTSTFADGSVYVGEWAADKRHGQGTGTWADGDKYVGAFANGTREGQGTYTFANGRVYVGEWAAGNRHGQGSMTWPNGDKYVGEWASEKRHGEGTMTWANGDTYVGEWAEDKKHGIGTLTKGLNRTNFAGLSEWSAGVYIGDFVEGQQHGTGIFQNIYGWICVGGFVNNKAQGQVTVIWTGCKKYTGEFTEGSPTVGWDEAYRRALDIPSPTPVVSAKQGKPWLNPQVAYGIVRDVDGETYATIQLCNQEWMAENLRTTRYRNGDPIPNVTAESQWSQQNSGAWSHYKNDAFYDRAAGKLYNWYTVADDRNVCPAGWHVPTLLEWTWLIARFGGLNDIGGALKNTGTDYWKSPNTGASNSSGFSALPGSGRNLSGDFELMGEFGVWWSSTLNDDSKARYVALVNVDPGMEVLDADKRTGASIRCMKDLEGIVREIINK